MSVDPVGFLDTGHPAMFNRYAYTFNDPVNLTDPTGECPMCIGALSSVVLGAVIRGATGGDIFDGKAIAADAALGAVGAGIIGKAAQLRQISQAGTGISKSVALGKRGERAAGVAKGGKEGFKNAAGKQRFTDGGAGTSGVTEVKNVATLSSSNIAQIGDEAAFAVGDATKSGAMTLFTRSGTGNIAAAQTAASNAGANLTVKTLPNTGANGFRKGLFSGEAAAVGAAAGGGCAAASGGEHC
ncbi:MAG: putative toxin [Litorimonas sp.]